MADSEFEEFRKYFDSLPQHIKAPAQTYRLVHDVLADDAAGGDSSGEDSTGEDVSEVRQHSGEWVPSSWTVQTPEPAQRAQVTDPRRGITRRRRLPEIPKTKRPLSRHLHLASHLSLASELGISDPSSGDNSAQPLYVMKCSQIPKDLESSPDSDIVPNCTDGDSGNSTASDVYVQSHRRRSTGAISPISPSASICTKLELLEATHRGLYKFEPRHHDEITIDIGDPVYLIKESDDLWCTGVNLRTGLRGVFPSAYVTDVDYSDFDPTVPPVRKERYLLGYLGSVEARQHKGIAVIAQAVTKITGVPAGHIGQENQQHAYPCILEISDQGVRMIDKSKPAPNHVLCHDYFYAIKNVSFCGFHPQNHKYFGFVTKHPSELKFACHIFVSDESTRPVAEAIGRAFHRFYQKFIETAYPVEEIFMDF